MQKQALLPIGTIVQGRYLIEDVLGKGGFGAVYLVRDQRVRQNRFALKELIDPDRREQKHFFFEAKLLQRLNHPALPQVDRVFEDERLTRVYMLMDYVEGQNLEKLRRR
jgi:eukaryotic-like serine/threonine-protein kinase